MNERIQIEKLFCCMKHTEISYVSIHYELLSSANKMPVHMHICHFTRYMRMTLPNK